MFFSNVHKIRNVLHNINGGKTMNEENEINVLDELCKGACMGMDAIHFIIDKVEDQALKKELDIQYSKYQNIHNEILEGRGRILKHNSFGTIIPFLGIYLTEIDVHMYIINNQRGILKPYVS